MTRRSLEVRWRLLAAICSLAVLARSADGAGVTLRSRGFFSSSYTSTLTEKECTCNCCIAVPRRPNEVNGDVAAKCAVPPENDPRLAELSCTPRCSVVNDPIFPSTPVLEYNRFCFFHCAPTAYVPAVEKANQNLNADAAYDGGSLVDTDCVTLSGKALQQAIASDQNGRDAESMASPSAGV
eukprot:TRINITY_DN72662_c0_g1_i1.p1 TRINITY_DN72662_c0_g1~~TRINITY_DN72662_c0_g1_i1.p1  ORF type:complete len:182 (-),score=31.79 TRINITY_DN72662_c0_g1_i1:35-580(-)